MNTTIKRLGERRNGTKEPLSSEGMKRSQTAQDLAARPDAKNEMGHLVDLL
jgi:hypothetical protein